MSIVVVATDVCLGGRNVTRMKHFNCFLIYCPINSFNPISLQLHLTVHSNFSIPIPFVQHDRRRFRLCSAHKRCLQGTCCQAACHEARQHRQEAMARDSLGRICQPLRGRRMVRSPRFPFLPSISIHSNSLRTMFVANRCCYSTTLDGSSRNSNETLVSFFEYLNGERSPSLVCGKGYQH